MCAQLSAYPPSAAFVVSDPQVLKEMALARARFPKPVEVYAALSFYGPNIVASEHDAWRRFRKICAPSFSEVRRCRRGRRGLLPRGAAVRVC